MAAARLMQIPAATQAETHPASAPVAWAMVREASACRASISTKRPKLSSTQHVILSGTIEATSAVIVPETLMTVFC